MMIRCSEKHRQECLAYLRQNPSLNLFLIGDIENYGFNQGFQTVFIDKDEFVHGIYLVYYHNLVIASEENRVDPQFVERLVQEYEIQAIQGRKEVLEGLVLDAFSREECLFCELNTLKAESVSDPQIREARPQDAGRIKGLLDEVFQPGQQHGGNRGSGDPRRRSDACGLAAPGISQRGDDGAVRTAVKRR